MSAENQIALAKKHSLKALLSTLAAMKSFGVTPAQAEKLDAAFNAMSKALSTLVEIK